MPDLKMQELASITALTDDDVIPGVNNPGGTPTDGMFTVAVLRKSMVSSTTVAFTDGDTWRRTTVTDSAVASTSKITCTVRRPDTDDSADTGLLYLVNVLKVANGAFDVGIMALSWSGDDPTEAPPNETITLNYTIG